MATKVHPNLQPLIKPIDHKRVQLVKDFFFTSKDLEIHVRIPAGYIYDGASIPLVATLTTGSNFDPEYMGPALVHDYLYQHKEDRTRKVSRKEADLLFLECLKLNGVGWYTRKKMYWGVRAGGGFHYN